jgi:hypothetical protein
VSKTNDLKARIQGKKTAAESFIETGLRSNQGEENVQNNDIDENIDVNVDVDVDNDIGINDDHNQIDLKALRQKVKQQSAKKKTTRFEDEHKKLTVWVKNDAFEILQLLAANKKGEKTRIVTEALMKYASEYMKK